MMKKKSPSKKELLRREAQSFAAKGGSFLSDGDGGLIRAFPHKKRGFLLSHEASHS